MMHTQTDIGTDIVGTDPHGAGMSFGRISQVMSRMNGRIRLLDARVRTLFATPEAGAATAEYAVVLVAATGFAGLLVALLKSDIVRTLLTNIVKQALKV